LLRISKFKAQKGKIIMRLAIVSMFAICLTGCPEGNTASTAEATTTTATSNTTATTTGDEITAETTGTDNTATDNTNPGAIDNKGTTITVVGTLKNTDDSSSTAKTTDSKATTPDTTTKATETTTTGND